MSDSKVGVKAPIPGDRLMSEELPANARLENQPVADDDDDDLVEHPSFFRRYERFIMGGGAVFAVLAIWEIAGKADRIDPLFFSYPSQIWDGFMKLSADSLWKDVTVSGTEFIFGFFLAMIGIPLGLLFGHSRLARYAAEPFVNGLYATPTVALTPLFVIWFGLGMSSKVAVIVLMAIFPILINTMEGVRTIDPVLLRATRTFGASRWQVLWNVTLPATFPFIITGIRLAIGKALIAVVIGEFIGSVSGIGYRIRTAAETFQTSQYLAATGILMILSIFLTALLQWVETKIAPWRQAHQGE
jgi:NitT/TauT family transport system permease protein